MRPSSGLQLVGGRAARPELTRPPSFPRPGHTVPLFSFGTYQLTDPSETQAAVLAALAAGVRSLDTAQFYGNEAAVGAAVRASGLAREDVIVTTKVYRGFDTPAELDQNVQESVDALGLGQSGASLSTFLKRRARWAWG